MNLFTELIANRVKSEPDVWIGRVAIFERLTPEPVKIRDIPLSKGLNIIWAEETEDDDPVAEITGHSAGKTTFCRLLRYLLGEKTFGTKAGMDLIHRAFPQGYVAAELMVQNRHWAVRRPFGGGRLSYVMADVSIEELLQQHGRSVSQESYTKELGLDDLVSRFEIGGIARTGGSIQWGHLLAWCTRDQEARFQSIHDWRSPRSESDAPGFRFPKSGPLFVMRAALGLFLPNELSGEEKLATLQRRQEKLTKDLDEKKREPAFRVNLYEQELREQLGRMFPEIDNLDQRPFHSGRIDLEDLNSLTNRATRDLENSMKALEEEEKRQQSILDEIGVAVKEKDKQQEALQAIFDLAEIKDKEIISGIEQRSQQEKELKKTLDQTCPYGKVLVGECKHVLSRQQNYSIIDIHDERAMSQFAEQQARRKERHEAELNQLKTEIEKLNKQQQEIITKIEAIRKENRSKRDQHHDLRRIVKNLTTWLDVRDKAGSSKELDRIREKLLETEQDIAKTEKELASLLSRHSQNRKQLTTIFSAAVRSVLLAGTYDGEVRFANRELEFRITHGTAMTGEAVETLAVLLADVSCQIYNATEKTAMLPGFLMHDSPREADLGKRLYHGFIRFVAKVQELYGRENCPFQYILTTTTAPPKELQSEEYVSLRLNAAKSDELLFRCNFTDSQKQLKIWGLGG